MTIKRWLPMMTAAAVVAATTAVSLRGNAPPQQPAAPVIATVDLEKVFNAMTRLKEAEAQLEAKLKPYKDRAEALKQEIDKRKQDVDSLAAGTPKHLAAQRALSEAAWEYRAQIDFINARTDAARGEARTGLYQHIQTEAAAFCQDHAIDLLVADDSRLALQPGQDMQVVQQLALRRVVYSNTALDITDALVKWINAHP